jgi:starch synthase
LSSGIGFDEELSHLIYAGADMIIMPSLFEPCGLTQMIALKYGTVPIVREVGGLKDTVFDKDYSHKPWEERNGYVFQGADHAGVESAMHRAIACGSLSRRFPPVDGHGMSYDYSWCRPGQDYMNIYEHIRCK